MSTYSLQELLERLEGYDVTLGWGAVFAFSRSRLNAMLEQQFTAAFTQSRFINPCSGTVGSLTFTALVFGAPVLSFEISEGDSVSARLTIPILSGILAEAERTAMRSPTGARRRDVHRANGSTLRLDIDLDLLNSQSDQTGRVTLDLAKARNPVCNLIADPNQQQELGDYLLEYLRDQPAHQTTFELAVVDSGLYAPLNPVKFVVRTQSAPGARVAGALNEGDGAVLIFMKLKGLDSDDGRVPGQDYPYLIPNDSDGGEPRYNASFFVSEKLTPFISDANLTILKDSVLPDGYAFVEADNGHFVPHDHAFFGSLAETRSHVRIEPAQAYVALGQSLDFTALRGDGTTVADARWNSGCINSPLLKGKISSGGRFSATDYRFEGPPGLMTTVSAQYTENGQSAEATAFVLVQYVPLRMEPLLWTVSPGGEAVSLEALGSSASEVLTWSLLEPGLGELQSNLRAETNTYTPPPAAGAPLVAQRIRLSADAKGHSAEAAMMLVRDSETLPVFPPLVAGVIGQGEIHFEVPADSLKNLAFSADSEEDLFWRWSVVGEGTITGNGRTARFQPPATRVKGTVSVIVCELLGPGVEHLCGYSLVELATGFEASESPTWEKLNAFEVTVPDGAQAFANGMQQIRVRIRLEVAATNVDDEDVFFPVSPAEMNTLRLVYRDSQGSDVPYLDPTLDGMEHDDNRQWAASIRRNRFNLYPSAAGAAEEHPLPASDEGTTYADRYLYLRTDSSVEFYAQFRASNGAIMRSTEVDGVNPSITVKGVTPPSISRDDYKFERQRVWNGEGKVVEDDDFTYMLQSIDFWRLSFLKSGYEPAGFTTLRIEENTSSIQWESELLDETFFSCSGYVFHPKQRLSQVPTPAELSFDPYLLAMMDELDHVQPDRSLHSKPPQPGELIVSLHRESDVTYWYDGMGGINPAKRFRAVLDRPIVYDMRDENGNRHRLQVGFKSPTLPGSRNEFDLLIR